MSNDLHELPPTQVDVSGLIHTPGAQRRVDLAVPTPEGFEVPLTRLAEVVRIDGVLESLLEGVLLRGTLAVEVAQQCATCLDEIPAHDVTADVAELFTDPATLEDPEDVEQGYEIRDEMIDLDAMLRDALAEAVPDAPRCREDCAGLCPHCGTNRNHGSCSCADEQVDARWAALEDLKLNP